MNIEKNISLKKLNSFGIDVTASHFAIFKSVNELKLQLNFAVTNHLPILILGGGSNVLFTKPIEGIVLKNEIKGIELYDETSDHFFVTVGAGENWHQFVLHCIENNWCGVENLSLIPGSVGAAPMQNIGAYGIEVKEVIESVNTLQISNLTERIFKNEECKFGYRESIFKNEVKGAYIITSVNFKLKKQPDFKTDYGAIKNELEKLNVKELSIRAISDAVINIRNSKLPNPAVIGNAGSFFKNPSIDWNQLTDLQKTHPNIVYYPNNNGTYKIAAGWLIEQCGLKGVQVGNTGCHAQQSLVLVNYGNANGKEIFDYSTYVIEQVYRKFGIPLEREVNVY